MSAAKDVTGGGSARQCADIYFAEAAPHPALRAALPTRGRDRQPLLQNPGYAESHTGVVRSSVQVSPNASSPSAR